MPRVFSATSLVLLSSLLLTACQKKSSAPPVTDENLVTTETKLPRTIGDETYQFGVLGADAAKQALPVSSPEAQAFLGKYAVKAEGEAAATPRDAAAPAASASLTLAYPVGLLGEAQLFGGVVTKLSDKNSETLGRLKLIDLTPVHVRPMVLELPNKKFVLSLLGCADKCTETSPPERLVDIPITGVSATDKTILVDLSALGDELNLIKMVDPDGSYTKLKTKTSKVTTFDYSVSTLVFDVDVTMVPKDAAAPQTETTFTVRWYLRLGSIFHSEFVSRPATPGVGFFMTERGVDTKILRHTRTPAFPGEAPVHYFIKNVPKEHQAAFKKAFDNWNVVTKKELGQELLSIEFVDATDPKAKLLVTGDPRFNIIEWDLDNLAPYGGLGPSVGNQFTGEILTSNILVQGPKIVEIYTKWFKVAQRARRLNSEGKHDEAMALLREQARLAENEADTLAKQPKLKMSLGKLEMRVPAQMPELEDPLFARDDFELLPPNMTYDQYMDGYFQDLVGHEMGHNLGLRHNFRGNLGAANPIALGKVSTSIMEYLGRAFRYLDRQGPYDSMALAYGYTGKAPVVLNGYCTDENVAELAKKGNSPECSRDDATSDPFSFFEGRLERAATLLANPGQPAASTWTVADLETPLTTAVTGLGLYASSATTTGSTWTNFFKGGDRPWSPSGVKAYVAKKVKGLLCAARLQAAVQEKATAEDRKKTTDLLNALRAKVAAVLNGTGVTAADVACSR